MCVASVRDLGSKALQDGGGFDSSATTRSRILLIAITCRLYIDFRITVHTADPCMPLDRSSLLMSDECYQTTSNIEGHRWDRINGSFFDVRPITLGATLQQRQNEAESYT